MSDRQCEFWNNDNERCTNPARCQVQQGKGDAVTKLWTCAECYDLAMEAGIWEDATYES